MGDSDSAMSKESSGQVQVAQSEPHGVINADGAHGVVRDPKRTSDNAPVPELDTTALDPDHPATASDSPYSPEKLRFWNRIATGLHFTQFLFMLIASVAQPTFRDFKLNLTYTYFSKIDENDSDKGFRNTLADVGAIRIAPLICVFFLLSALFQGATTVNWFGLNEIYNADLARNQNRFRWYECALSSGFMIWIIAMFAGVSDLCALINIFAINGCMNLFGLLMEHDNSISTDTSVTWRPFVFGCLAGLPPWISTITSLVSGTTPPGFVYGIFISYIIMFCTFPANMILQYRKVGPWADYRFGEYVYIILSLVAKSLLGWLVFGGLNAPNAYT